MAHPHRPRCSFSPQSRRLGDASGLVEGVEQRSPGAIDAKSPSTAKGASGDSAVKKACRTGFWTSPTSAMALAVRSGAAELIAALLTVSTMDAEVLLKKSASPA